MTVEKSTATIDAGAVQFSVRYVDQDGRRGSQTRQPDQGVSIQVLGSVGGEQTQLLRFDCFDRSPHYHYDPNNGNERVLIDKTASGNPIGWTLEQLRQRLPAMLTRAGFDELADTLGDGEHTAGMAAKLDEVESAARDTALKWRRTVTHNGSAQLLEIPGCEVIEAGNIRFGLEFRKLPGMNACGVAIHVLSDVAGQEIEILAFDCFDKNSHYHYGPRNKDLRHYWDTTVVPDPLRWVLDRFREGRLPSMIEWAGYPSIAAELDTNLIATKLAKDIEPKALALRASNTVSV